MPQQLPSHRAHKDQPPLLLWVLLALCHPTDSELLLNFEHLAVSEFVIVHDAAAEVGYHYQLALAILRHQQVT